MRDAQGSVNPVLLLRSYDSDFLHYRIHLEAFPDREESEGALGIDFCSDRVWGLGFWV